VLPAARLLTLLDVLSEHHVDLAISPTTTRSPPIAARSFGWPIRSRLSDCDGIVTLTSGSLKSATILGRTSRGTLDARYLRHRHDPRCAAGWCWRPAMLRTKLSSSRHCRMRSLFWAQPLRCLAGGEDLPPRAGHQPRSMCISHVLPNRAFGRYSQPPVLKFLRRWVPRWA
jgi:hypothetical protein